MKKKSLIVGIILLFFLTLGIFIYNSKSMMSSVNNVKYYDGNEEEKDVLYIEPSEGVKKNTYTADNPLILTVYEEMYFHLTFNADDYNTMKENAASAVFTTDEAGNIPSNVLSQSSGDAFWDSFGGIRFAYRAFNPGDCRVVIYNKNTNEIYHTLYVRVIPGDTIHYRDNLLNKDLYNPSDITVDTGEELVFEAVLTGNLNMNGDVPSEENFYGSGFWSWDVPVTNEWKRLENNKWLVTYKITTQGEGNFTIGLGKNGNGQVGSVNIHVVQNKIELDNVNVGTYNYSHVNKNIATKMFNGFNRGDNNPYNRYAVYIGEDLKVNASVPEGYYFELANTNSMKVKTESSYANNMVSATFTAINSGDNEILLKNADGVVTETFFVQVHYPFYVDAGIGELHKDLIHEYLDIALHDFYVSHNDAVVTNPDGVPQYVKNGRDYYMFYYVFSGNSVNVVSYVNADDDIDFDYEGNLDMKNHKIETVTSGPKAGYKRISADFSVNVELSGGLVRLGNDTFVIAERNGNDEIHHFDLETADGGTFKKIEKVNYKDGYTLVTETIYSTRIDDIHGSKIYDADGELIREIKENEYWLTYPEGSTQFESTSAYLTNDEGHLIDRNNRIIDDLFRGGLASPIIVDRHIPLKTVDKVDFDVDILLTPVKRTVREYKRSEDGELELVDTTNEEVLGTEVERLNDYILTMSHTQIVDAFNKCPYHSGLDFTIKIEFETERDSDEAIYGQGLANPETMTGIKLLFAMLMIVVISFILVRYFEKKKESYN